MRPILLPEASGDSLGLQLDLPGAQQRSRDSWRVLVLLR